MGKAFVESESVIRVALVLGSDPTIGHKDPVGIGTELLYKNLVNMIGERNLRTIKVDLVPLRPNSFTEWVSSSANLFEHYDLVHIPYYFEGWGASPAPGLWPGLLKLIPPYRRAKLVTTIHEWRSMHTLRKASAIPLIASADGILFVSMREQNTFKESLNYKLRFRKPLMCVMKIGVQVDVPELHTEEILGERDRLLNWGGVKVDMLLGYFGSIYAAKQPDRMLRSLRALLDQGVKARLVIVGDFPDDHVEQKRAFLQRIESLRLDDNVLLLGFVADERALARTLSACNVALLLFLDGVSAHKGSFWTVLEFGMPIITTKPPSNQELADLLPQGSYKNLRFVETAEEPERVADAVRQFSQFSLPQQQRGIIHDWKAIASEHIAFYRNVSELSRKR